MAAIFVGSSVGAMLGAAYLFATPKSGAALAPATAPALLPARPVSAATALQTGIPPAGATAEPLRLAVVAGGARDLQCLTEAVYFESRGEPERGQRAVAQVVLNRVRHPAFPKTVCGVVHQKIQSSCQFSFACAPEPRSRDEDAWKRAQAVAKGALHGSVVREIGDATHFESVRASAFAGLLKVAQIGEHVFYRFSGRAGAPGLSHPAPAPSAQPRLLVASLSEPPPAVPVPTAPAPVVSTVPVSGAATSQGETSSPDPRPADRSAVATSAPSVVKPIPPATVKPSAAATPVTQS